MNDALTRSWSRYDASADIVNAVEALIKKLAADDAYTVTQEERTYHDGVFPFNEDVVEVTSTVVGEKTAVTITIKTVTNHGAMSWETTIDIELYGEEGDLSADIDALFANYSTNI